MKEKTNRIGIRETLAIHRRAVKDMRHRRTGMLCPVSPLLHRESGLPVCSYLAFRPAD